MNERVNERILVATGKFVDGEVEISLVHGSRIKWRQTFVVKEGAGGMIAICECGWQQQLALQRPHCPKCGIAQLVHEKR